MIYFSAKGDFKNTDRFLRRLSKKDYTQVLELYGAAGVEQLTSATPVQTGKTALSWSYEVRSENGQPVVSWNNSNVNNGVNVAVILDKGHGTGWGGYVAGRDYIKPAIEPIFDAMADGVWKEVTK